MNKYIRALCSGVLALSFGAASAQTISTSGAGAQNGALASNTVAAVQPTGDQSAGLDEVVVTARRRSESLQAVPLAVTVLSQDALRQQEIEVPADLEKSIPSLTVAPSIVGGDTVTFGIRGERNLLPRLSNDPSVAVYVNDVVQARPYGLNQSLYDVSSVQVLAGPQGTLFGRNTTGGAVLFETNKPTQVFSGSISDEIGNYGDRVIGGYINIPLTSTLSVRLAGQTTNTNGYVNDVATGKDLDNVDGYSMRASALWQPTSTLSNLTVYDYFEENDNGPAFIINSVSPTGAANLFYGPTFGNAFGNIQAELAAQQERGFYSNAAGQANYAHDKAWGVANTTTADVSSLTFKNIFGYRKTEVNDSVDFDGTPLDVLSSGSYININQYSDELQVLGKAFNDSLSYIGGLYYFRESGTDIAPTTALNVPVNPTNPFSTGGTGVSTSKSIFTQGTYAIPQVPGLNLTLGARYTWDYREVTLSPMVPTGCAFGASPEDPAGETPCAASANAHFTAPTGNISIDYTLVPGTLVYLTSRHGYRSGGFNIGAQTLDILDKPFAPEKVTDVEVGIKSDYQIAGIPMRTNVAAYYTWADDLQRSVRLDPGSPVNATINAATGRIYGGQIELTALPTTGLSITAFGNYDHARYVKFVSPAGDDYTDDRFSYTPLYKIGLNARYEYPVESLGRFAVQTGYVYQAGEYFDDLNTPGSYEGGYGLLDARGELNGVAKTRLDVAVFVKNLANKEYAAGGQGFNPTIGFNVYNPGPPRMFGAQFRYHFGD